MALRKESDGNSKGVRRERRGKGRLGNADRESYSAYKRLKAK